MFKQLKVTGTNLTVRKGGFVNLESGTAAPARAEIFAEAGLSIPKITTGILSAKDPVNRTLLKPSAGANIGFFKLGYFKYSDMNRWKETLDQTLREIEALGQLGRELGLQVGLHNHSGSTAGGGDWEGWDILRSVDRSDGFFSTSGALRSKEAISTGSSTSAASPAGSSGCHSDSVWSRGAQLLSAAPGGLFAKSHILARRVQPERQ